MDWIEFNVKGDNGYRILIRPSGIIRIAEVQPTSSVPSNCTLVFFNENGSIQEREIAEPYAQVKQKIIEAEKKSLNKTAVRHFTRDEYKFIKETCEFVAGALDERMSAKVIDKLNEILKEEDE